MRFVADRIAGLSLVFAVVVASGCATPGSKLVVDGNEALRTAPVVSSLAEVPYVAAVIGEPVTLSLQPGTPTLDDGISRRFVAGMRLPAFTQPYGIEIVSPRAGTPADPGLLYPVVHLLDAGHAILRTIPPNEWRVTGSGDDVALTATMFVNADRGERFVAVLPARLGAQDEVSANSNVTSSLMVPIPVAGGGMVFWMIPVGGSSTITKIAALPVGSVRITLKPYSLRKVGER